MNKMIKVVVALALALGAGCSPRVPRVGPQPGPPNGSLQSSGTGGVPGTSGVWVGTGGAGIYCTQTSGAIGTGGHAFDTDVGVDAATVSGAPTFTTRDTRVSAGSDGHFEFVAVGELSGDGKPDVVLGDRGYPGSLIAYLGNGDGTFSADGTTLVAAGARLAVLSDLNGDGTLDVIAVPSVGGDVRVLLSQGGGVFAPAVSYATAAGLVPSPDWLPTDVAAADLNGDGFPELAATGPAGQDGAAGGVRVLVNDGHGAFAAPVAFPAATLPIRLLAGDANADGRVDLLSLGGCAARDVLLNGPAAGLSLTPTPFSLGAPQVYSASPPNRTAFADLNGDGRADLVSSNYAGWTVDVSLNVGQTFSAPVRYGAADPTGAAVGDINGDGRPDLLVGGASHLSLLLGAGDGSFGHALRYLNRGPSYAMASGDLNGDGRLDVVLCTYDDAGRSGVTALINSSP